jgi:hypothetical protein
MLGAIVGIWASQKAVLDTFQGVGVPFPVNLSPMPSTAKTFTVTPFQTSAQTGFGVAVAGTINAFPTSPQSGFDILLGSNIVQFPTSVSVMFNTAGAANVAAFPVNLTR